MMMYVVITVGGGLVYSLYL